MYKLILILFISFFFVSCHQSRNEKAAGTYIGGLIENPKGDYIVLAHNGDFIDSIKLDNNNRFLYKNDTLIEGLYTFKHREYQRFYLYPNDSLLLHLNTIDFDESLKYSGIGAKKNNLLMKIFLADEKVQNRLSEWLNLSPELYLLKIDSVNIAHNLLCKKYTNSEIKHTNAFKQTVSATLTYDDYLWKELYLSAHLMEGNEAILEQLPNRFLKHRKEIDFGNDLMHSHYSYYRFMDNYFNNLAYESYKNVDSFSRNNYTHAMSKLLAIRSLTYHETLRNKLLRQTAVDYLLHTTDAKNASQLFNQYKEFATDRESISDLEHILSQTLKIIPGKPIPNVQLVGIDNTTTTLHEVIKKPTVIYFWTYESATHYREVHQIAKDLRIKYKNYDFIAINADDNFRKWKRIAETLSADKDTEYQLENAPSAKSVLILDIPERTIIVNRNGKIINANCAITHSNFEKSLQ